MKTPIISRVTDDPARFKAKFKKSDADIDSRFKKFRAELKKLLKTELDNIARGRLTGNTMINLFDCDFTANSDLWGYFALTASLLARVKERIQGLIDRFLIGSSMIDKDFFLSQYIELSAETGAKDAFKNLSAQSEDYKAATAIKTVLESKAYSDAIAIASDQALDDYKSVTDGIKRKVSYLLVEGVAAGVSPFELAEQIADQGVSPATAKNIARTEMIGAYRKARIAETERYKEAYGVKSSYMWLSALSPSTRRTHAARHGKLYTKEDISSFYSRNGNKYNCKCSFTEVLINDNGNMISKKLNDRLKKQRTEWINKIDADN